MWPKKPSEPGLQPEDRRLVQRLRAGDEEAFERFFDAYFHAIYRFALARLGQETDLAKEIAQATLCTAFEKLHTYRGEAALFSWLCSICRFEISGHFRRERRLPPQTDLVEEGPLPRGVLESLAAGCEDPENELLRREVARLVHLTVDHLPLHYGQVLEWKYSEGLSVKQIAEQLGVSPKAVESLLTRARQAFRDGFASLAGALEREACGARN
ncbi:MAG TPA: sigma-70 family RNA polymerase sigma factor [Thermoanaerobaculia bacterium]|jgi:RNA polymerase sigma-70 factor (ECF subfamily)|nr:sigma-70 family RNA polymerase sigma factor [Thermoanaerobaculia bacterium]